MTLREEIDGLFNLGGMYLGENFPPEEAARIKARWAGPLFEVWERVQEGDNLLVLTTSERVPDFIRINPNNTEGLGSVWGFNTATFSQYTHMLKCREFDTIAWDAGDKIFFFESSKAFLEMAHRFSCVLDHATGGRMSKTNYTKEAMYSVIDDHITDLVNQEIHDQKEAQEIKDFDFLCDAHKEDDDAADPA